MILTEKRLDVLIPASTDSGVYPHGDNGKQFARTARFSMTPAQAIQSATTLTAELLGWEDQFDAIEPGCTQISSRCTVVR